MSARTCSTSTAVVGQPWKSRAAEVHAGEARCVRNSDLVTTGTWRSRERGVALHVGGLGCAACRSACCQRIAFSTRALDPDAEAGDAVTAGGSPVVIDVSAAGVVDGTTVVIDRPSSAESSGSSAA